MITQDISTLPTFNPHGGPITHSFTGSKPDSPVHPYFQKLFLTLGFVCKSRARFLAIYSGIRRNTYSHCSGSPSYPFPGNEGLPICLKLLTAPSYFALAVFLGFQLERWLYASFLEIAPRYLTGVELRPSRVFPLIFSVSTMKILKEGRQNSSWCIEAKKWRHQCKWTDLFVRSNQGREDSIEIS